MDFLKIIKIYLIQIILKSGYYQTLANLIENNRNYCV